MPNAFVARVIPQCDRQRECRRDNVTIDNLSGKDWAEKIISELKEMPNVIVKNRSQVFGYYDHNMTVMFERVGDHLEKRNKYSPRQRLWYIRAKQVFLAT